jgi:DNA transformation protein and related proteins
VDEAAIQDLFEEVGPVRCRRMFGGQGIYAGDVMFALEAGGEIFLKVDDGSRAAFEAAGSRPFVYGKEGRAVATSYWRLPDGALDDPSEAVRWARLALDASRRKPARRRRARR